MLQPGARTIGFLGLIGLGAVAFLATRKMEPMPQSTEAARRNAFRRYLTNHLTGADAAIILADRLAASHPNTPEGALGEFLAGELRSDRELVNRLLAATGGAPASVKRLVGRAALGVLQVSAAERTGLALFESIEALSVGVQGKRCLWLALQGLGPAFQPVGGPTFVELEQRAIAQWERIEICRQRLAREVFGVEIPAADEPTPASSSH
jgi:hypothetical protein